MNVKKIKDIIEWAFLVIMLLFLALSVKSVVCASNTGEGAFVLGYRPIYLVSGSMEPTIKTGGLALTKRVDDIDDIAVGDIITFHTNDNNGTNVNVTHRIVDITSYGGIVTKGDNNDVADSQVLDITNVDSKVIFICNQIVPFIRVWNYGLRGKLIVIFIVFLIFVIFALINRLIKLKIRR